MTIQHQGLAERWGTFDFNVQMANIASEVERALNWKNKGNMDYSQKAFERALELIDLSLNSITEFTKLRELARVREALVDYFFGVNEFGSNDNKWRSYFSPFTYAARRNF